MNKTIKSAIYNVIRTITTMLFPLITYTYASHIFFTDGMGKVSFSKSLVSIFTILAMLGINKYGIRECARVRDDKIQLSKLYFELLIINIISATASYILLFIIVKNNGILINYISLIAIFSLNIGLNVIGVEWLYIAVEDFGYITKRTVFIQLVSLILLFTVVHNKNDIYKFALIQVLSASGSYIYNFIYSRKYIDWKARAKLNCKQHLIPILSLFAMTFFIQIFTDMDTTMLGFLSSDRAVGLYNASYKISSVMCSFIAAATAVVVPQMARYIENSDLINARSILKKSVDYIFMIGLPVCIGSIIFSKSLIIIVSGSEFIEAELSGKILAIRGFFSAINGIFLLNFLTPMRKDNICIFTTMIAAGINVILNFILIPAIHQNGASIATVAAELSEFLVLNILVSKYISLRYIYNEIWKYFFAVIVMAIIVIVECAFIENMIVELILAVVTSSIVYFQVLNIVKCSLYLEFEILIKNFLKNKFKK